jgi:hypothetical protein
VVTDEELYEHVKSGGTKVDPNKRKYGDPGIRLEQLMRFFDPKLARVTDDSNEVGAVWARADAGVLWRVSIAVFAARVG